MTQEMLAQLLEISHGVGANPEYVQAGGGNTSVKSPDGRTMAIKASGTPLGKMSESAGWVEMDIAKILTIFDRQELATLLANEREALIVEHLASAVVGKMRGRPSVESALHALLGKAVIHTHPVAANALTCGPGEKALPELTRPGELPPLWIPYCNPGWTLARITRDAVTAYEKKHGQSPAVLLLGNHGLITAAATGSECLALHNDWVARCEAYFAERASALTSPPVPEAAALRQAFVGLSKVWREARGVTPFIRFSAHPELASAASHPTAETLASGVLTPDIIVYSGVHAVIAESLPELPAKLKTALAEKTPPRLALVRNLGSFVLADDALKLKAAEEVGAAAARIARLAAGRGGAHNLPQPSVDFIVNWEAEHYRASLLDSATALLAGKVAVVTGAASGIGWGIAQGMIQAGAAVAFCDLDEPGAVAAAAAAAEPRRALALHMDVTDEQSVIDNFDRVLRHWGHVDVCVCTPGVAPPYDLVDLPLDKWRLALEVNLTGYFLACREAARIMKAQGTGGAMLLISSKTGLDPSMGNTAYNATKAGELHMMRGWALELGPYGIRTNAIAPGNVFEGSKIWTPQYFEARARKKGIKVEEVIPYYNSLTALKREIKRTDIAAAAIFLCSEQARCITGQTLIVDSGQVFVR
jgi:NAD(P)-dependent dehydrogenase (short-subunit alcohol dehydrogenase family)/rhamnose utilization protein RhaD (predicted bifunctional aldolase and dehydrogenase)